jgi:hypothetical protein
MIEFKIIHPDTVGKLKTGNKDFKTTDFFLMKYRSFEDDKTTSRILDELSLFVIALVLFLLVLCVACVVMKKSQHARDLLKKLRDMIFFNMIIRSMTILYIKLCITFGQEVESFKRGEQDQLFADSLVGITMFVLMIGYPIMTIFITFFYKARLE